MHRVSWRFRITQHLTVSRKLWACEVEDDQRGSCTLMDKLLRYWRSHKVNIGPLGLVSCQKIDGSLHYSPEEGPRENILASQLWHYINVPIQYNHIEDKAICTAEFLTRETELYLQMEPNTSNLKDLKIV